MYEARSFAKPRKKATTQRESSSSICVHWSEHNGPMVDFIIFAMFEWAAMKHMVAVLAHMGAALAHMVAAM